MSKVSRILSIISINVLLFSAIGSYSIIYADDASKAADSQVISNARYTDTSIYNVKIAGGEQLSNLKSGENIYKADVCSNKNEVVFQVDLKSGFKASDFIVTGDDNSIIGVLSEESPHIIKVNLNPAVNTITIKSSKDNCELYKFYINYENVTIDGLGKSIFAGDTLNLSVKSDNKTYDNVKWNSSELKSSKVNENGSITILKPGIANVKGIIYDGNNNIIGNLDVSFNVCGERKTGWVDNNGKWSYIDKDTQEVKTGWIFNDGEWYCSDSNGIMQTGWICQDGIWYYLKENGTMATSWIKDNGKWYLMDAGGAMKKGWAKDHGNWYYLDDKDGSMQTGTKEIDGVKYIFNAHGELQNNNLKDNL